MASHSGLSWWLDQIGRIPLLTPAQEIELGTAVQAWLTHTDGPEACPPGIRRRGHRAKEKFIRCNLRLAVHYVSKHCHRLAKSYATEDLIQAANEGVIKAVEKFDPTLGYRFTTYAYWWIRQSVNGWIDKHDRLVAIPASHNQLMGRINPAMRRLQRELGRTPTREELAEAVGVSLRVFDQLLINARPIDSLDHMVADDGLELGDLIAVNDQSLEEQEEQQARWKQAQELQQLIAKLPRREQQILVTAWGLDGVERSKREQAKALGLKPKELEHTLINLQAQLKGMAVQLVLVAVPIQPIPPKPRQHRKLKIRISPGQLSIPWPSCNAQAMGCDLLGQLQPA